MRQTLGRHVVDSAPPGTSLGGGSAMGDSSRNLRMHPWQCYITVTASAPDSISLKINRDSCLWDENHASTTADQWAASYDSAVAVVNINDTFVHTSALHVIYNEATFYSPGIIISSEIKSGAPWSNFPLVYDTGFATSIESGSTTVVWRQLLARWQLSGDTGYKDAKFDGDWYELICPTTTHLIAGITAKIDTTSGAVKHYPSLAPWHGTVPGS